MWTLYNIVILCTILHSSVALPASYRQVGSQDSQGFQRGRRGGFEEKPFIKMQRKFIEPIAAEIGSSAVLTCEAGSGPIAELSWFKNGIKINQVNYRDE